MKDLETLLKSNDYKEILNELSKLRYKNLENQLTKYTYNSNSILGYTLINLLLAYEETAQLHYLASTLLSQPLNYLEDAYESAFFHAKRAIELDPKKVKYKEYILLFNEIPDKLLSNDRAEKLAKEILSKEPNNKTVLKFIK